jgi:hypothetical protein
MLSLPMAPTLAETHDVIGSGFTPSDDGIWTKIGADNSPPGGPPDSPANRRRDGLKQGPIDIAGRRVRSSADRETAKPLQFYMRLDAETVSGDRHFLNSPLRLTDPPADNASEINAAMTSALGAGASSGNGFMVEAQAAEHVDGARSTGARGTDIGKALPPGSTDLRTTTYLDFAVAWRYRDLDRDLHRDTLHRDTDSRSLNYR